MDKRFFIIFFILDVLLIIGSLFCDDKFLLNTQVGVVSAVVVAFCSYVSYKIDIQKEVQKIKDNPSQDKDELDKIDDVHELWEEDINHNEISPNEIKKIIHEEKQKIKQKSSIKNILQTYKAVLSPIRIIGYVVLIVGFLWLNKNGLLSIVPYMIGLSLLPISVIILSFITV